jgi:hypothetical protein
MNNIYPCTNSIHLLLYTFRTSNTLVLILGLAMYLLYTMKGKGTMKNIYPCPLSIHLLVYTFRTCNTLVLIPGLAMYALYMMKGQGSNNDVNT